MTGALAATSLFPSWAHARNIENAYATESAFRKVETWTDDCGLRHDRISPYWQKQCELLPCFQGVAFPGYAERIIVIKKDNVQRQLGISISDSQYRTLGVPEGKEGVILHLWKGLCPKFRNSNDYPGGYGAELGIYLERTEDWLKKEEEKAKTDPNYFWGGKWELGSSSLNPGDMQLMMLARRVTSGGNSNNSGNLRTWYPAPELGAKLRFRLLTPDRKHVFIDTEDQNRFQDVMTTRGDQEKYARENPYWCTDWISTSSYKRVSSMPEVGGLLRRFDKDFPVYLVLQFWVNGIEQTKSEWGYMPGDENCSLHNPVIPATSGCTSQQDLWGAMTNQTTLKYDAR
ncbi:MAG: hypothetical protein K9J42_12920 [Sulfuritalea sp.]|nr:hypothetical protein [Sulfuritalea sp.]